MRSEVTGGGLAAVAVGGSATRLFSMRGEDRLEKTFLRLDLPILRTYDDAAAYDDVLLANADYVFEERVISDFIQTRRTVLVAENENGVPVAVAAVCRAGAVREWAEIIKEETPAAALPEGRARLVTPNDISGSFNQNLRKREAAMVLKATPDRRDEIERRMFKGAYKGATDVVTKFVMPEPALHATRLAAALGLRPNIITAVSLVLVCLTIFFFMRGEFIAGAAVGWLMSFLDTVDGKLARVTLQSSKFGDLFDHGIDIVHPPFWYAAWAYGVAGAPSIAAGGSADLVWSALWIANIGYVIGRLIEGYFVRRFKFEIHIWRPVDYWFRHITSRRNPNLVMLTISALLGAPALGLFAVAGWTVFSIVFHSARAIAAEAQAAGGGPEAALQSWLAE